MLQCPDRLFFLLAPWSENRKHSFAFEFGHTFKGANIYEPFSKFKNSNSPLSLNMMALPLN